MRRKNNNPRKKKKKIIMKSGKWRDLFNDDCNDLWDTTESEISGQYEEQKINNKKIIIEKL